MSKAKGDSFKQFYSINSQKTKSFCTQDEEKQQNQTKPEISCVLTLKNQKTFFMDTVYNVVAASNGTTL